MNAVKKHIKKLLESGSVPCPPPGEYWRVQDDHDGTFEGRVCVGVMDNGDAYLATDIAPPIRYRNMCGGGMSLRTHAALLILAEAIRLDELERPISRPKP